MSTPTIRAFICILWTAVLSACFTSQDTTLPLDQQQQQRSGDLDVAAATSGTNPDTDGYRVSINEDLSQTVAPNGHTVFLGLLAGTYRVQLSEVSTNCTVAGDNPRDVTVYAGTTSNAAFVVQCSG